MLYAIHTGAVEGYQGDQAAVLHLVSSVKTASTTGQAWCFTDGHAELGITEFSDDLDRMDEFVDAEIMQGQYWNDTPDQPDRKRRRQAEFLVREGFPWKLIHEIGVYDAVVAAKVGKLIAHEAHKPRVVVQSEWYY